MDDNKKYDVVIIGGGPAGSAAGIFLSNMGFRICIVEKKAFPRDTLCGEFLSREVIHQLKEWGFLEEFLLMKPNPINTFKIINTDGNYLKSNLNFPAYGLSRSLFDNFLLNKAKENGAEVLIPAKVMSLERSCNEFTIKLFSEGKLSEIKSELVIGAYGKRNLLDRYFNREFVNTNSGYTGIKFHAYISDFNNLNENEIRIYAGDYIYCGINKVNGGLVTVCWLENRLRHKGNPEEHLKVFLKLNKVFSDRVSDDLFGRSRYKTFGSGNIYFGKREVVKKGIFMIGDAARVIAPVAGDGIAIAFESAGILSNILLKYMKGLISGKQAENEYRECWDDRFKRRFAYSDAVQKIIFRNFGRKTAMKLIRFYPAAAGRLVELTRG